MWQKGRLLGKGAFGSVYLATLSHDGSVRAVKSSLVSNSCTLSRERKLLNKFEDCPYIIRCFGSDITTENGDDLYNLFLEYASGGTLLDHIKAGGLDECKVKRHAESILTALDYIHKKGYAHCDIKPDNILLVEKESSLSGFKGQGKRGCEFTTKVADFGLAKRAGKELKKNESNIRGTPMYLAPESFIQGNYNPKADIWAFGCTVLQLLTGKTPWDEKTEPVAILFRLGFSKEIPEIPDWVSQEARDFLEHCLVRDPESRWSAEMLLRHPFVFSTVNGATESSTQIGENIEVVGLVEETEEKSSMCGLEEYLSILMKPYFCLSENKKRKIMQMIAQGKIKFGINWLGLQYDAKREKVIPSVNTRIEIFN